MPAWRYYTAADLLELPEDGDRYEVLHGALLVTPSPRKVHQRVVSRLVRLLGIYLDRFARGEVYAGGDEQSGLDRLVILDVLVLDLARARAPGWPPDQPPLLVIEVLSPSTAPRDRFTKRRFYQDLGVPLYWLVDADTRVVKAWTPDAAFPVTEHEEIRWHPEGATAPLVIRLVELLREV